MQVATGCAQHIGGRQQQQDTYGFGVSESREFVRHGGLLSVVADGMGGMAHGDAASKEALRAFREAYQRKSEAEGIAEALLRSLAEANRAVLEMAERMGAAEEMGTTLVATVVHEDALYWISAGDSGIFLWRDDEFTQLNQPHIFAVELEDQARQGVIPVEVAKCHPEREALTSFVGMRQMTLIDRNVRAFRLRESDLILLATDGLFKTLSMEEIGALVKGDSQGMCDCMVKTTIAQRRPYQDNVTVVAVKCCGRGEMAPRPGGRTKRKWLVAAGVVILGAVGYWLWPEQKETNVGVPPPQPAVKGAGQRN